MALKGIILVDAFTCLIFNTSPTTPRAITPVTPLVPSWIWIHFLLQLLGGNGLYRVRRGNYFVSIWSC